MKQLLSDLELRAKGFAYLAHRGQKRKYTGEDYIVHPGAVADLVRSAPHTDEMLAAAWLHDTVEDCGFQLDEIHRVFNSRVAELVEMLTDVSKKSDGNRAVRKAIDLAHTAKADGDAQTIKLADIIDNARSITKHDPDFSVIYLREKYRQLQVLKKGDKVLWDMADSITVE